MSLKLTKKQAGYIRPVAGILILIIGVASMFLPFLPIGYLFTIAGIILLAPSIPFLKRFLSYLKRKDKKGRVKKVIDKVSDVQETVEEKVMADEEN